MATLANWWFVLCHFPSILGISYIVIPRKLTIFKYWSHITIDFGDVLGEAKHCRNQGYIWSIFENRQFARDYYVRNPQNWGKMAKYKSPIIKGRQGRQNWGITVYPLQNLIFKIQAISELPRNITINSPILIKICIKFIQVL